MGETGAKLELVEATENSNLPQVIVLSSDTPTILGRSSKMCQVVLDASPTKSISRRHAEIVCIKGARRGRDKYTLRDLDSTNGVFVNDFKVKEHHLEHGDVVQFGGAADIPVGTRFGGTGSHIRYRFDHEVVAAAAAQSSRKRRHSSEPIPDAPAAQRTKLERANTQEAVEALHAISNGNGGRSKSRDDGLEEGALAGGSDGNDRARGGGSAQLSGAGRTPPTSMVTEVLRDAMCGLCSELLLDAGVLPCSHSFCRMCWADHVEEKGTTCPVCLRKLHSSERNPRQCSNLDLLITSIVHKLADPPELKRWKARQQEHAQKRDAKAKVKGASSASASALPGMERRGSHGSMAANTPKAMVSPTPLPTPSPARSVHFAENNVGRQNGIARGDNAQGGGGSTSRQATGGGGVRDRAAAKVAVPVPVKCEGCNEAGHEFRECPHRSDSALEGSDVMEDSDSDSEDDGGGEDEDSDSDDA